MGKVIFSIWCSNEEERNNLMYKLADLLYWAEDPIDPVDIEGPDGRVGVGLVINGGDPTQQSVEVECKLEALK